MVRGWLLHISTDYVFDGARTEPYREEDDANPISVYGESKREGEKRILAVSNNPHLVVARISWVFGPDRPSFVDWIVQQARTHDHVEAVADKISTPTYTLDLAELLRPLLAPSAPGGLIHSGEWRQLQFGANTDNGRSIVARRKACRWRAREVGAITLADMKNFIARRPAFHGPSRPRSMKA